MADDEKEDMNEYLLRERARYKKELEKEDQRLWDGVDMQRKAYDVRYGLKAQKPKDHDIPPHIMASAHISTAMQGSIVPGIANPNVRRSRVVLDTGRTIVSEPFASFQGAIPKGLGDRNTDELLQSALKRYLAKGDMELKSRLQFNDRPQRGLA